MQLAAIAKKLAEGTLYFSTITIRRIWSILQHLHHCIIVSDGYQVPSVATFTRVTSTVRGDDGVKHFESMLDNFSI